MGVILNNLIPIIGSSIAMSIPLVLASVGGAFSVRSGIMALGLESMMMMGAFFGVLGSYFTGSVLFGFLLGMVGGMVIGLFHGILSVRYKVNQVISGIGLNLLALAVTTLLMQLIWNNKGSTPQVASISTTLDFFAPIPVIGPILAQQSVSFLVMVAVVIVGWIVLFKTRFGLRLRMVGENPKAAATMGLRVHGIKYCGVLICGAYGKGNAGDDAILKAILAQLKAIDRDMPIYVMSHDPAQTRLCYHVGSVHVFDPFAFWPLMRKAKLFVSGGGSLIQNETSTRSLNYYLTTIRMAHGFHHVTNLIALIMLRCGGPDIRLPQPRT